MDSSISPSSQQQQPAPEDLLVNQFNRLGTTDREVLVQQLQKLVGPEMGANGAHFFLDMNNWNLQLALNAYFDLTTTSSDQTSRLLLIESTQSSHSATIHPDQGQPAEVLPGQIFTRNIHVLNSGNCRWEAGGVCLQLREATGDWWGGGNGGRIVVEEAVEPHSSTLLSLHFQAPPTPGQFSSRWQMSTTQEGILFGEDVWLICIVLQGGNELAEQFGLLMRG